MKKQLLALCAFFFCCIAMNAQDMISARNAITMFQSKSIDKAKSMLEAQGYSYKGQSKDGFHYWCKNCNLTPAFKPTAFAKGTSSVIRFKTGKEPSMRIQVFNERAANAFYTQAQDMGLWDGSVGMYSGARLFSNKGYPNISVVIGYGEVYQQEGGYMIDFWDDEEETEAQVSNDEVKETAGQMPIFQGNLKQWLAENITYPTEAVENGIQGRVVVRFIVEKDGSISNAEVIKSVDPSLDAEALRVVRSMPKWRPGKDGDNTVRVKYSMPIVFGLQ